MYSWTRKEPSKAAALLSRRPATDVKILTYTSLFPNHLEPEHGIFIYRRMSSFAARRGNSVVVVAPVPYYPAHLPGKAQWSIYSQVARCEKVGNLVVHHPRYFLLPRVAMALHGALMYLGTVSLVRHLHREQQFDCIDAHYVYPDGLAAVLIGRTLGIPVVVSARGTDINLFPTFSSIGPMIRWTLQRVAGAISVCTPLQDRMLDLGLNPRQARVIGNGVDLELFQPVGRATACRRLGIQSDQRVLISVGSLIPRKGFHLLIPAFARIAAQYPDAVLYIVGEGPYRQKLEEIIKQEGMAGRIALIGARTNSQLKDWYSAAHLSCLTSSREGWPNVVLESMACGTPVLATKVWGVPEIIKSPELGVMVEQDVTSIANGLAESLSRSWDRERIVAYAQRRTWDVVAAEVEDFIMQVLGRTPQARAHVR